MEDEQPNLFVRDELDSVELDAAETEDLETNYVALLSRALVCFSDSDSTASGGSRDSDSDSSWPGRNQIEVSSQMKLRSRSEGLKLKYSLRHVLPNCSGWNGIPHIIEEVFRMNSYIVDPNYLLCISKYHSRPLTIDFILSVLQTSPPTCLPKWSEFEPVILEGLSIYEKFEGIPNSLSNLNEALELFYQFQKLIETKMINVTQKQSERKNPSTNFFVDLIATIKKFIAELKKIEKNKNKDEARMHTKSLREDLFEQYFSVLFSFFNEVTNNSFRYVSKRRRTVEFSIDRSRDSKVITAIPDIEIFAGYDKCVLVGEVKRFGARYSKYETHRGHRVKDDCTHSTQADDDNGRSPQTNLEPEEPPRKQAKLNEDVCREDSGQVEALGPEESGSKSTSNTGIDLSKKNKAEGESGIDGSGDSKQMCKCHYRHLDKKELYRMNGFLPQLFGGMLVSKYENGGLFEIGGRYDNIQLGFSLQGFKLRFVRMVLRDSKEIRPPSVEEFFDNERFKCDLFLTQELNLFKRKHLIMFFQIMYAISYCSFKYFHSPY